MLRYSLVSSFFSIHSLVNCCTGGAGKRRRISWGPITLVCYKNRDFDSPAWPWSGSGECNSKPQLKVLLRNEAPYCAAAVSLPVPRSLHYHVTYKAFGSVGQARRQRQRSTRIHYEEAPSARKRPLVLKCRTVRDYIQPYVRCLLRRINCMDTPKGH